jgi:hypothetical protein
MSSLIKLINNISMYEYIIIALGILLILFAVYMGLFNKLDITEQAFPGGYYIYYDY